jgi:hypothetical protein
VGLNRIPEMSKNMNWNNFQSNEKFLSTPYTILPNVLSRLIPYIDEIIEDHQHGF